VYSVFLVIIFVDLFMYLTIGIRAFSLAKEGNIFLLFLQIFFSREKRGRHTLGSYMKLCV
jgi:hypothetical protein